MTVRFRETRKPWRQPPLVDRELTLWEMLVDPIVIRLMGRDGVVRKDIVSIFSERHGGSFVTPPDASEKGEPAL